MNKTVPFAALLLILTSCHHTGSILQQAPVFQPEPVTVRVMKASGENASASSGYVGTVEAGRSAVISANNAGTISALPVKEGQKVAKDQLVAQVESQSIRSAYDAAKAQLEQAEDGWTRIQKVYESGSVTELEYVRVRTQAEQARAAELAARKALWHCTLRAPFNGTVEKVYVSSGMEAKLAEPLLSIVDLSSPEVHFPLPENEFARFKPGDKALITVPALDRVVEGRIRTKGVVASPLSHSYDCILDLKGDLSGIMPGMVCKVRMDTPGEKDSAVIPASAVRTDMQGRYVWTATEGTVSKKYITVGGYAGNGIIVSSGLDAEDLVIVEGSRKVSTGMKVKTVF